MANERNCALPFAIAVASGMALWFAASLASGPREAWDAAPYWVAAYPLALLAAACLGYACPERAKRLAVVLFAAQFVAMCIRNGELGNLWPLGLALFTVLALPAAVAARLAARLRRRTDADATR
jgi:hypothetical protein